MLTHQIEAQLESIAATHPFSIFDVRGAYEILRSVEKTEAAAAVAAANGVDLTTVALRTILHDHLTAFYAQGKTAEGLVSAINSSSLYSAQQSAYFVDVLNPDPE